MKYFLRTTLELVIIKKKVMDITNLGWNPTKCNKKVVKFIGKRDLIHHYGWYFDKNANIVDLDDLAIKYNLPLLSNELWDEIIPQNYQPLFIQADRVFKKKSRFLKQYLARRINDKRRNKSYFSFV